MVHMIVINVSLSSALIMIVVNMSLLEVWIGCLRFRDNLMFSLGDCIWFCGLQVWEESYNVLTLKVLKFWKFTSYCSLKLLWSGMGESSAGSYLADPTSPIPSYCASIVATSTLRVNML